MLRSALLACLEMPRISGTPKTMFFSAFSFFSENTLEKLNVYILPREK